MKTLAVLVFSVAAFATTDLSGADRVQSGQWQTKMTMGKGKPMVSTHCINVAEAKLMNGDAATVRKYVEESTAKNTGGRCSVKTFALSANRSTVTIACGKTRVTSTTNYYGDHSDSFDSNGTKIEAKRIGSCKG